MIIILVIVAVTSCKKDEVVVPCNKESISQDSLQKLFKEKLINRKP